LPAPRGDPLPALVVSWCAVHPALELREAAADAALGQLPPAEVHVLGAGAELALEGRVVDRWVEAVGHHVDRVGEDGAALLEHAGHRRVVHGTPVADVLPGIDRVVAGDVDRLEHGDVIDPPHPGGRDDAQDLGQAGVHAGPVEGGACLAAGPRALLNGRFDLAAPGL
jgi:hypothetical protein